MFDGHEVSNTRPEHPRAAGLEIASAEILDLERRWCGGRGGRHRSTLRGAAGYLPAKIQDALPWESFCHLA